MGSQLRVRIDTDNNFFILIELEYFSMELSECCPRRMPDTRKRFLVSRNLENCYLAGKKSAVYSF